MRLRPFILLFILMRNLIFLILLVLYSCVSTKSSSLKKQIPVKFMYVRPLSDSVTRYFEDCFREQKIEVLSGSETAERLNAIIKNMLPDASAQTKVKPSIDWSARGLHVKIVTVDFFATDSAGNVAVRWFSQLYPKWPPDNSAQPKWQFVEAGLLVSLSWREVMRTVAHTILASKDFK